MNVARLRGGGGGQWVKTLCKSYKPCKSYKTSWSGSRFTAPMTQRAATLKTTGESGGRLLGLGTKGPGRQPAGQRRRKNHGGARLA